MKLIYEYVGIAIKIWVVSDKFKNVATFSNLPRKTRNFSYESGIDPINFEVCCIDKISFQVKLHIDVS